MLGDRVSLCRVSLDVSYVIVCVCRDDTHEYLSQSRVEFNLSHSRPFTHPDYATYNSKPSNLSIVIMSSVAASATELSHHLYSSLSKIMYAKRHGYTFHMVLSNDFSHFLPKQPLSKDGYFRGVMSKPISILDTMYQYLDREWLVFTDDDLYINPGEFVSSLSLIVVVSVV